MLGGSKAEGDLSKAEWEKNGVVQMLRRRSLRGFWKRADVGKRKGVFWRDPKGDSIEEKRKAWGRILKVSEGLAPREKEKNRAGKRSLRGFEENRENGKNKKRKKTEV